MKNSKGITLIALVVTIVVLLILAGISINMLVGENGIISQAQNARKETEQARVEELVKLAVNSLMGKNLGDKNKITPEKIAEEVNKMEKREDVYAEVNKIIFPKEKKEVEVDFEEEAKVEVKPGKRVEKTEKDNYTDINGDKATVPGGFTVSGKEEEQKVADGLVIYDIPENEEVDWEAPDVQTKYNQFVWIPVKDESEYQRNFNYPSNCNANNENILTDTEYLPKGIQPEIDNSENNEKAEREAVLKYSGFYIGRYEAGKEERVVSKQNAVIYTNVSQTEIKVIAKTMYDNEIVKSAICSGIQWDIVMKFVDGKNDGKNKVFDVTEFDSTRHTGSKTTSGQNLNDKVQNIYDLEGNGNEYVVEKNNVYENSPFIYRGGYYNYDSYYCASRRSTSSGGAYNDGAFRPILYIM